MKGKIQSEVSAAVGGKMAQLGSRLVQVAASAVANQFFSNLQRHLQADALSINESPAPPGAGSKISLISIWARIIQIFSRQTS